MRVLSKSRFKLGLECPNKLFFTNDKTFANKKASDSFLQSLAEGGFQVEALARLHYPDGIFIDAEAFDYEKAVAKFYLQLAKLKCRFQLYHLKTTDFLQSNFCLYSSKFP